MNPQVLQTRPRQQRQFKEPKVKCSCSPVFAVEKQFGKTSGYFSRKVATFREKWLLFNFSRKVSTFRLFDFSAFLLFGFSGSAPKNQQLLFDFSLFRVCPEPPQTRKVRSNTPNPHSKWLSLENFLVNHQST